MILPQSLQIKEYSAFKTNKTWTKKFKRNSAITS